MVSLLGLITLLLRLTLVVQSHVITFFPGDFAEDKVCNASGADDFQLHSILETDGNNAFALCEAEEEEKSESETEVLADLLHSLYEAGLSHNFKTYYNPFFGNKALQGDQHLYDLFHSWKTHLS